VNTPEMKAAIKKAFERLMAMPEDEFRRELRAHMPKTKRGDNENHRNELKDNGWLEL